VILAGWITRQSVPPWAHGYVTGITRASGFDPDSQEFCQHTKLKGPSWRIIPRIVSGEISTPIACKSQFSGVIPSMCIYLGELIWLLPSYDSHKFSQMPQCFIDVHRFFQDLHGFSSLVTWGICWTIVRFRSNGSMQRNRVDRHGNADPLNLWDLAKSGWNELAKSGQTPWIFPMSFMSFRQIFESRFKFRIGLAPHWNPHGLVWE
jgi:hypothetical protein